jgi:hypothetical protein
MKAVLIVPLALALSAAAAPGMPQWFAGPSMPP